MSEETPDGPPPLAMTVAGEEQPIECRVARWEGTEDVLLRPDWEQVEWLDALQPGDRHKAWWVTTHGKAFSATVVVKTAPEGGNVAVRVVEVSEQQRRSATRFEVAWPVSVAVLRGLLPDVIETVTGDVSFHGLSIKETDVEVGDRLAVVIWLPDQGPVLGIAEVRRINARGGESGLQITQLTEQHQSRLAQELWDVQRMQASLG